MSRIGKCMEPGCNGEISTVSYGNWREGVDGVGCCNKCFKEYPLEMKGLSNHLTLFYSRIKQTYGG